MAAKIKSNTTFSGNIYGFSPSINSFQGMRGKIDDAWSTLIKEFIINGDSITFWFIWEGYKYVANLKQVNATNYQGRVICDGEQAGKIYYTLYQNEKGYAMIGTWTEDDYNYDSLIEVRF